MQVRQSNTDTRELGRPTSIVWNTVRSEKISLVPAPVDMQPSKYIQAKWKDNDFGKVSELGVQVLHNGKDIAFRLEWESAQANTRRFDNNDFADGAALLFPLTEYAPLFMGEEGEPTSIWHWRADREGVARSNISAGIGTSRVVEEGSVSAQSDYQNGRWTMVFCRAFVAEDQARVAQFEIGRTINIAFAIWDGGNAERGGLKSFSPSWFEVQPIV